MSIIALRKAAQGPLGKFFLAILFFSMFAGFGLTKLFSKFFKGLSFDGIALVNNQEITKDDLQKATHEQEQRMMAIRQKYGVNADLYFSLLGINQDPQVNAFMELIHGSLLEGFAENLAIAISPEYLEASIADRRFLIQELGHILPQELFSNRDVNVAGALAYLKESGQMPMIEKELKIRLKKQFALHMLHAAFLLPEWMLKQLYKEKMVAKKFSYQIFELETFIAQEKSKNLTDGVLQAFYNQENTKTKRYWTKESRDAVVMTFEPEDFGVVVTPEELSNYYAKHKSTQFIKDGMQVKVREIVFGNVEKRGLKALKQEADQVREELKSNPDAFIDMVKKYSTHKESADKDGLVDFFKRSTKSKEYERAAFMLKADGDISEAFETSQGYVILQRVARKEPTFESFETAKSTIQKKLLEQKFKSEFTRQSQQLIRSGEATQEAIASFVATYKGKKDLLQGVQKSADTMMSQRLFALKNTGDMTSFIKDGKGIMIELKAVSKPKAIKFEDCKTAVSQDYVEVQATQALEQALKQAKIDAVVQNKLVSNQLSTIQTTGFVGPDDKKVKEELTKKGFTNYAFELDWQGAVITGLSEKGGLVIRLDELERMSGETFETKKSEFLQAQYQEETNKYVQAFIASLCRNATIEINDELSRVKEQL